MRQHRDQLNLVAQRGRTQVEGLHLIGRNNEELIGNVIFPPGEGFYLPATGILSEVQLYGRLVGVGHPGRDVEYQGTIFLQRFTGTVGKYNRKVSQYPTVQKLIGQRRLLKFLNPGIALRQAVNAANQIGGIYHNTAMVHVATFARFKLNSLDIYILFQIGWYAKEAKILNLRFEIS